MQIVAIASGKGGVGKSLVAANLAIALSHAGKRVVLADLDLGGSNLHLILGEQVGARGIGTFLNDKTTALADIVYPTAWKGLEFIPGEAELPGAANPMTAVKRKLIRALARLDADYLILDLGAGTSFNTVDFFLSASCGIVVTTPTVTSTLNGYLFLKNVVFRVIHSSYKRTSPVREYLEKLRKDGMSLQRIRITRLLDEIDTRDGATGEICRENIARLRPRLIMNLLDNPEDVGRSQRLRVSVREYLGIELESLGVIYRDHLQDAAERSRLPILAYKPRSVLSQAVFRIADKILALPEVSNLPMADIDIDDGFREQERDAESDFRLKSSSMEELLHSGALTPGDLVETIRMQHMDINRLKKENRFLKKRLVEAERADSEE